MSKKIGLKQRLEAAKTVDEVKALLNEGAGYPTATSNTRRKWIIVANRKLKEFENAR